ncbi:MAG: riboflavin kinase [Lawsonibacter sp.]
MERANQFLGHPHTLTDRVAHGKKIGGSTLGFPTVNLRIPRGGHRPRLRGVRHPGVVRRTVPLRRDQRGGAPHGGGQRRPGHGGGLYPGL